MQVAWNRRGVVVSLSAVNYFVFYRKGEFYYTDLLTSIFLIFTAKSLVVRTEHSVNYTCTLNTRFVLRCRKLTFHVKTRRYVFLKLILYSYCIVLSEDDIFRNVESGRRGKIYGGCELICRALIYLIFWEGGTTTSYSRRSRQAVRSSVKGPSSFVES